MGWSLFNSDFPLDGVKWFVNEIINALSRIHEVNFVNFINNLIIVITVKESTLMTVSFKYTKY